MTALPQWLLQPTAKQLTLGGDARLLVNPESGLNRYGCSPVPREDAFSFASSTATSISRHGYEAASLLHNRLINDGAERRSEQRLAETTHHLADLLVHTLQIHDRQPGVLLSSSGTDSQLHATAVAACPERIPLISIVCGSDETGSGTPYSVTGHHFDGVTALGRNVHKGSHIEGFPQIDYRGIPFRDDRGYSKSTEDLDEEVRRTVTGAIQRGYFVLLHLMDQSKLGSMAPSSGVVDELQQRFGETMQIIVDACQLRLDAEDLAAHLDRDHIVLVTGSKFFTGPPFSGASLFPRSVIERWSRKARRLPPGLADYLDRCMLPDWLAATAPPLPAPADIGMRLRWIAALEEMSRYFAIPRSERLRLLDDFGQRMDRILGQHPELQPITTPHQRSADRNHGRGPELSSRTTLLPFRVLGPNGDPLSTDQSNVLYRLLNQDLTRHVAGKDLPADLARRACHVGQPVPLGAGLGAALRVSIGARILTSCNSSGIMETRFLDIEEKKLAHVCEKAVSLSRQI